MRGTTNSEEHISVKLRGHKRIMRTLKFEVIADSRFHSNPKEAMELMAETILKDLNSIPNVKAIPIEVQHLKFPAVKGSIEPSSTSERTTIIVQKNTRLVTWNNIYGVIGRTKPAYYSFVDRQPIR